jgi:glycosyltransferase involved in cell wall biosynthesis
LDLNMLVSDEEGFGRVILEAGAAGVPTVGSRVGGIPELIKHDETGFLLGEPGSDGSDDTEFWHEVPNLVKIAGKLAGNHAMAEKMGNAAREWAEKQFSVDQYVQGCVRVFEEAIAEFDRKRDQW